MNSRRSPAARAIVATTSFVVAAALLVPGSTQAQATRTNSLKSVHPALPADLTDVSSTFAIAPLPAVSHLELGVTHTQSSPLVAASANGSLPGDTQRIVQILRQTASTQNVSLMGWGVGNPEPSPGIFSFSTLDARVRLILQGGGTPVITLCGAPDWMKGGVAGQTDWSQINTAPRPAYYAAFAQLAVTVARRYPEIHTFQIWNELKGFWNTATNNWNMPAFVSFYNTVYDALKSYNPNLLIGGPYVPLTTWGSPTAGGHPSALAGPWGTVDQRSLDAISYFLKYTHGTSFLALDGGIDPKDGILPVNPFAAVGEFTAVDHWIEIRSRLPIWWSEWYVGLPKMNLNPQLWAALATVALGQLATSGASTALMWDPGQWSGSATPGLWTGALTPTGVTPTALVPVFAAFKQWFTDGTPLTATSPVAGVVELTSGAHRILVDTSPLPLTVPTSTGTVRLSPYQIFTS